MAVHMVSYGLKVKNKDNQELREAIEKYENTHLHESLWLIDTLHELKDARNNLKHHLKEGGKLFVCRLRQNWASRCATSDQTNWLESEGRAW